MATPSRFPNPWLGRLGRQSFESLHASLEQCPCSSHHQTCHDVTGSLTGSWSPCVRHGGSEGGRSMAVCCRTGLDTKTHQKQSANHSLNADGPEVLTSRSSTPTRLRTAIPVGKNLRLQLSCKWEHGGGADGGWVGTEALNGCVHRNV